MKSRIIILILVFLVVSGYSTEWISKPRLNLGLRNSYDSNILKVTSSRDSNRVNGLAENFRIGLRFWSKLNRQFKIFHSFRANYLMFPGNTFANRWGVSYRSKAGYRLFRKRKHDVFPTTRVYFLLNMGYADKYYSDRALGEENIINVNNTPINLKDLFDNFSIEVGPQIEFTFSRALSIDLEYVHKSSDFKNISEPSVNYYYSLDNSQTGYRIILKFTPMKQLEFSPYFGKINRKYEDKFDKSLTGQIITGQKREYTYTDLGLDVDYTAHVFTLGGGYEKTKRKDGFEGYYDYDYSKFFGKLAISINNHSTLSFYLNHAKKDYSNLSLLGQILKNTYDYFKADYEFLFMKTFLINTGFIYDKESSTYYKYNYKRWLPYLTITYQFFE